MKFEKDIMENLGKLPKSLEGTYSEMFDAMREEGTHIEWEVTRRALMWISCSRELLTKKSWAAFSYWPEEVPEDGYNILLELCRNLVTWDSAAGVVRFSHLSVQEYLHTQLDIMDQNSMAAKFCLGVLGSVNKPESECLRYSNKCWLDHIECSYARGRPLDPSVLIRLKCFFGTATSPSQAYDTWLNDTASRGYRNIFGIFHRGARISHADSIPRNPLFLASCYCFGSELGELWSDKNLDIHCCNSKGETLLYVASMFGNEQVVSILLGNGANINHFLWDYDIDPLSAAMSRGHIETAFMLLDNGANISCYENAVEAAAASGSTKMVNAIMRRYPNIPITEGVLMAAAESRRGNKVMRILLAKNPNIGITGAVLVAAAGNHPYARALLQMLLAKDPDLQITEGAIRAGANNLWDPTSINLLLGKCRNITKPGLIAAMCSDIGVVRMVLVGHPDIKIDEAVVVAALKAFGSRGLEVLTVLLDHDPNIKLTEAVVVAMEACSINKNVILKLLGSDANIEISRGTLTELWRCYSSYDEIAKVLLAREDGTKKIEMVLVKEVSSSLSSQRVHRLLARNPRIDITEAVIAAAAGNCYCAPELLQMLLARNPNVCITEAAVTAALGNEFFAPKLWQMLLARDPNIEITGAVLAAALGSKFFAPKLLQIPPARDRNIEITGAVSAAALGNEFFALNLLRVLLARDHNIEITGAVLAAALGGRFYAPGLLQMPPARDHDVCITEATVTAALGNDFFVPKLWQMLLARDPNTDITEAVVVALVGTWGWGLSVGDSGTVMEIRKIMETFVATGSNINITKGIVVAVAENGRAFSADVVEALLDCGCGITQEAVMSVAREIGSPGIWVLRKSSLNIEITPAVLAAAVARNRSIRVSMALTRAGTGRRGTRPRTTPRPPRFQAPLFSEERPHMEEYSYTTECQWPPRSISTHPAHLSRGGETSHALEKFLVTSHLLYRYRRYLIFTV